MSVDVGSREMRNAAAIQATVFYTQQEHACH
jgi:hypothetical protein